MRDDAARLLDILNAARQALDYVRGVDVDRFESDAMLHDAVIRQLEIVGEATRLIPEETRARHPELSWAKMAGLRNVLAHEYFQVDYRRVWQITQTELPALIAMLEPLIPPERMP